VSGGSPRFKVVTNVTTFFLGCNNVTATINANGTDLHVRCWDDRSGTDTLPDRG